MQSEPLVRLCPVSPSSATSSERVSMCQTGHDLKRSKCLWVRFSRCAPKGLNGRFGVFCLGSVNAWKLVLRIQQCLVIECLLDLFELCSFEHVILIVQIGTHKSRYIYICKVGII